MSMDSLTSIEFFGIPGVTLAVWFAAGLVAGALLMGRRPIGLLGDLIIGVIGGFLGGWVTSRFPEARLSNYIGGVDPAIANYVGEFLTAVVGAIVVLLILRLLIRRKAA
jgi:uncharacterized membrane protein YeaQ/YmgE (transglycosylase-associated protein family)